MKKINLFLHVCMRKQNGLTLVELVVVILLLAGAISAAAAGFTALQNMGIEKQAVKETQLVQQRLELILAEKRKVGFPPIEEAINGPDPCTRYSLDPNEFPCCGNELEVTFTPFDSAGNEMAGTCTSNSGFSFCRATVTVNNGRPFVMHLYDLK
jgi:type II secretory pathway pseudopilin PulG